MDQGGTVEPKGTVSGKHDKHKVAFLGLSTCAWCRRTRRLLEENSVPFEYTYLDLLEGDEKEEALALLERWNPKRSYPTVIIDDDRAVVGYKPDDLKAELDL
jgi:glutaredoxin